MVQKIRLLSEDVIGKIAAGEVVERPSAAIKEMVENSLDAGATAVTVEIRDGGISYFRVTDNGSGIEQSEIRMAFERHATSKITEAKDLHAISSLGFRGEALASIAAVSRVTCTTRTKKDVSGIKVINCGGKIETIEEAACPEGTSFVVKDLFYNTPVRLKFLKKPATEAGYVSDLMMRMILSRPDVSFRYIAQGKTLYHSAGDGKLESAVFSIYGKEVRTMRKVDGHQSGILLKGYIGMGESSRATRAHQSFFINGRYMKSGILSAAVETACREHVSGGRYPTCVLHLTMPYEMVDVNVHPNKLECRFQNDISVADAIETIVRDAIEDKNPLDAPQLLQIAPVQEEKTAPVSVVKQTAIPTNVIEVPKHTVVRSETIAVSNKHISPSETQSKEKEARLVKGSAQVVLEHKEEKNVPQSQAPVKPVPVQQMKPLSPISSAMTKPAVLQEPSTAVQTFMNSYNVNKPMQAHCIPAQKDNSADTVVSESFLPEVNKPLRIIGSAFNSYILVEYDNHLLLIDQQGVHERLLFDEMMKALDTQQCAQELLIPIILPATRREQQLLEAHEHLLKAIGLTVETFGETEVAIRSIPMILGQPQAGNLLRDVIDQLENERGVITIEKRRAGILALACKRSIRSGQQLNEEDIRDLVVRMVEKKVTPASPRGTPLIVALSHADIDRRFRRIH